MHGHHHIGRERLQLGDNLIGIVGRRRSEMEATNQRMQFLDAGDLLRLSDGVENTDVAARGDDNEAAILHVEAGRVLVGMLIWDDLALQFRRREMRVLRGVAAA